MEIKYNLNSNKGYTWQNKDGLWFIGYIFYKDKFLNIDELFKIIEDSDNLVELLADFNGRFTILRFFDNKVDVYSDKVRQFPIYYKFENNCLLISDSLNFFKGKIPVKNISPNFELIGITLGEKTLFKDIYTNKSAQILSIYNNEIKEIDYYSWLDYKYVKELNFEEHDLVMKNIIRRLILFANGRRIVIPLSGGQDSRIIAYYLYELGYKNVLAYTYGNENSTDVSSSKKLAEYFGFEWHFIPYEKKKLQQLFKSKEFYNVANYISGGFTIPHIQDWYAVKFLVENGIIDKGDIVVPGHSGDTTCDSTLTEPLNEEKYFSREDFKQTFVKNYYRLNLKEQSKYFKRLCSEVSCPFNKDNILPEDYVHAFDDFNFKERHSKIYIHAVKMYEYYDLKWYVPLWDNEFVDYWLHIKINDKVQRNGFLKFTDWKYGDLNKKVPFATHFFWKVKSNPLANLFAKISRIHTTYYSNPVNYYFYFPYYHYVYYVLKFKTSNYHYFFAKNYIKSLLKGKVYELNDKI